MDFALNVNMDGYNIHTQPTKAHMVVLQCT